MGSLNIAATAMLAQQFNVDVISNNIANLNTTAFKRARAEFNDLIYQSRSQVGSQSSDTGTVVANGAQFGTGVKVGSVYRIHEQGNMLSTGNSFDLAVQGKGYFQVNMPDGTTNYTRAGSLQLSPDGTIVTPQGYTVQPGITVPQDALEVSVDQTGQVQVKLPGQTTTTTVGQFQLATFPNEAGLQSLGDNMLSETAASGAAVTGVPGSAGFGTMLQGFLETSNVNMVNEITNMITAQRAYELASKVVQTSDEMLSSLVQTA
ncbi:MAG TPA: flagellar basal-body rod protein FlgG [Alphaproteobacteria bacterium]|jgi:flagellar basal-body rod protein FlgG